MARAPTWTRLCSARPVASTTSRIKIGFAVVEMAFHHPVRLAAQTALLDNLSRGRLIVGVGRGSAFNTYEYMGFGVPMDEGADRLAEAEDLLVKAWTTDNVRHKGKFWDVTFPRLRPQPYQKPHPPLVRACISEASTLAMARIGRPILMGVQEPEVFVSRMTAYRNEMAKAGFDEARIEATLDRCWFLKECLRCRDIRAGQGNLRARFPKRAQTLPRGPRNLQSRGLPSARPDQAPASGRGLREGRASWERRSRYPSR